MSTDDVNAIKAKTGANLNCARTATRSPAPLAPGLEISRIVTGLWQVADMERDGAPLDPRTGADALRAYARAGFDTSTWPTTTAAPN